jgi:hypothetical protein
MIGHFFDPILWPGPEVRKFVLLVMSANLVSFAKGRLNFFLNLIII